MSDAGRAAEKYSKLYHDTLSKLEAKTAECDRLREVINQLGWRLHNNGRITKDDWIEYVVDSEAMLGEK